MSIIKLTDPRYCSPLDPPLIPTYPPPAGEGGERSPRISREREDGNWDTQVTQPVWFHPRFSKTGTRDQRSSQRTNYKITGVSVESFQRVKLLLPLCPFPHLAAYTPDNRLRSRKCRGARAWLISRG